MGSNFPGTSVSICWLLTLRRQTAASAMRSDASAPTLASTLRLDALGLEM